MKLLLALMFACLMGGALSAWSQPVSQPPHDPDCGAESGKDVRKEQSVTTTGAGNTQGGKAEPAGCASPGPCQK
jgi:hypothetical protein